MAEECFRLGIVGAGEVAKIHTDALSGRVDARIVAAYDPETDRARALAARTGAHANVSYRQMLYEEALDGVIVCTPPDSHAAVAIEALQAGVHVLCEKPLTIDLASAKGMYDVSARTGRILMLASKFRYVPDVMELRKLIRSGELGSISHAEIVFSGVVEMRGRWNADRTRSGGGVLIDNGSHGVDLARYLFGELESVKAAVYASRQRLPVEDSACMVLHSRSGVRVAVDVTWSFVRDLPYYVRVDGTAGKAWAGWQQSEFVSAARGREVLLGTGYDKMAAFSALQQDFIEACRGARPRISAGDALAATAAVDAAYRSLETSSTEHVRKAVRTVRK